MKWFCILHTDTTYRHADHYKIWMVSYHEKGTMQKQSPL